MPAAAAASTGGDRRSVEPAASVSALGAAGPDAASARSAGWSSEADATLAVATSAVTASVANFMAECVGESVRSSELARCVVMVVRSVVPVG